MNKFELLAILLLVTLCTGFGSCSKDSLKSHSNPPSIEDNTLYGIFGLDRVQYKYLNAKQSSAGELLLVGLKNRQIWMAIYNLETKEKLYELIDTEEIKEEIAKDLGYGKRVIIPLKILRSGGLAQTDRGAIGQLDLVYEDSSFENYQVHQKTFFNNGNSIKKKTTIISKDYRHTTMSKWYKDAAILGNASTDYIAPGSYCCNDKGDTLYITKTNISLSAEAVSYEESIDIGSTYLSRENHKTGKRVWISSKVNDPFEIPNNTIRTISILDKSTEIWKCKVDLLYYDGTKKNFTFEIDISDGSIIGQDIKVTGITMNESSKELNINGNFQLSATVKPDNATNKNIKWTSSNESVATVDITGLVIAHSSGEAIITATTEDGDFKATATIKVLSSRRIIHIKSDDYDISLGYSNDKLSSYIWKYTRGYYDFNQNIAYNGNTVTISGKADGDECVQTYKLNKNGYATSCTVSDDDGKSIDISFEYSQEGYLTKAIEITKYNSETKSNAYTFTYSTNGNILKGSESNISGHIYTQSYGNVKNKSGIMDYAMSELLFNYQAAFYCGILGKSCTHLPSSCKETEVYEMGWSKTYEFIYAQDGSGYVTKTTIANSEGKAKTLTYTYK